MSTIEKTKEQIVCPEHLPKLATAVTNALDAINVAISTASFKGETIPVEIKGYGVAYVQPANLLECSAHVIHRLLPNCASAGVWLHDLYSKFDTMPEYLRGLLADNLNKVIKVKVTFQVDVELSERDNNILYHHFSQKLALPIEFITPGQDKSIVYTPHTSISELDEDFWNVRYGSLVLCQ